MSIKFSQVRVCRRLTREGWLLIVASLVVLFLAFVFSLYPFLAPDKPPHKGVMVVEGWIHDFALDEAIQMFRAGKYKKIICTGVHIETGSYIQQFQTFPEMTKTRLIKMGVPESQIITAIGEELKKDRTYAAAVALREAIIVHNIQETNIHLITTGPHGRRSRYLFRKALGKEYKVGISCLEESSYTPEEWHTCSEGVRSVIGELIAYTYAKLFFIPEK